MGPLGSYQNLSIRYEYEQSMEQSNNIILSFK